MEISISRKQNLALKLLHDPSVIDILFGGGAGGGKSFLVTLWAVLSCRKYAGIRIGLGRKEISNLRKTTVQTLLQEVHPLLKVRPDEFVYRPVIDPGIYYKNGSQILLVDLARAPSDSEFDRLGSLNLTHNIIEEAGEVVKKARDVFNSRKNRYLNQKYGIVGKSIATCNPSTNFLRTEYYDPYLEAGGGECRTWEILKDSGQKVMITLPDKTKVPARRSFVKSLVTDNPYISPNYIAELETKPPAERKRLLEGNWDYYQDENTLFRRSSFIRADAKKESTDFAGCDPSRGGDDCIFVHLKGGNVRDIEKVEIAEDEIDKGTFVAQRFISFCQQRKIGSMNAAVDIVGIGESVGDACNRLGFRIQRFNAGSREGVRTLDDTTAYGEAQIDPVGEKGIPLFDNIRSQNFYDMATAINVGELTFDKNLPYYDELCSQLEAHGYETKERMIIIDKKDKIKVRIGRSPDMADGLQAAWWVAHRPTLSLKSVISI